MKTYVQLWYLNEFFSEWEMFQTDFVEKIKTHFMFNKYCPKIVLFEITWENAAQDKDDNTILRMRIACRVTKTRMQSDFYNM